MKTPRNGYPALSVANHFIGLAIADNRRMDFPQLQAMLYLSHGWHLALTGRPLVNEPFYVWRGSWYRGPMLGTTYVEFNRYGAIGPIPGLVPGYSLHQADERGYAKRIMSRVWKLYRDPARVRTGSRHTRRGYTLAPPCRFRGRASYAAQDPERGD